MSSPIIPEGSGCGCCGRILPLVIPRLVDGEVLWCVDCDKHVSHAPGVPYPERTYYALQGRRCPFEGASFSLDRRPLPWFIAPGLTTYHLGSSMFGPEDHYLESWCRRTLIDATRANWAEHPPVETRCRTCTAKLSRVLAERVMQESVRA